MTNSDKWGPISVLFWALFKCTWWCFSSRYQLNPSMQRCKPFSEESRMFNCWLKYPGARHRYVWGTDGWCVPSSVFVMIAGLISIVHQLLFFRLEGSGRMNGGYDNAIIVIIIYPLYHDWLLPVTASFIILLEQRSYSQSMVLTALSWDGMESWSHW